MMQKQMVVKNSVMAAVLGLMPLLALPVASQAAGMDMSNADMSNMDMSQGGGMQMNMQGMGGSAQVASAQGSTPGSTHSVAATPLRTSGQGVPRTYPVAPGNDLDQAVFNYTRIEGALGRQQGQSAQNWDAEGWVGTDKNRFWWKSEGDRAGGRTENADVQALYSRYVAPFWDFQTGVRHRFRPNGENDLVVGIKGLAPYKFDVDAAAFVSTHGAVSARLRGEYELLLTQRLVAKPFAEAEMTFANGSDPTRIEGTGLNRLNAGVQVRYEITRKLAPFVEVARERTFGGLASEARARGDNPNANVMRAGLRLIF